MRDCAFHIPSINLYVKPVQWKETLFGDIINHGIV